MNEIASSFPFHISSREVRKYCPEKWGETIAQPPISSQPGQALARVALVAVGLLSSSFVTIASEGPEMLR